MPTRPGPLRAGALVLLGALLIPAIASTQVFAPDDPAQAPPLDPGALAPYFGVQTLSLQELQPIASGLPDSDEVLVEVGIAGETWTLALVSHSVRSDRYRVLVDDGSGVLQPHPEPPVTTRRGTVLEVPGSRVSATLEATGLLTALIHAAGETWVVQPVSEAGIVGREPWHVVFASTDTLPGPWTCGTPDGPGGVIGGGGASLFGTTLFLAEIGIDADFEFFGQNGSNVNSTVNDIEGVMNAVGNVFDNSPILIDYEISTIVVRTTSADPFGSQSNPGALLDLFEAVWETAPETSIQRDLAHLFTGVNLSGSVIGIANLPGICNGISYGVSQSRFTSNFNSRVALTTHELGHNWWAEHCNSQPDCRIMCSGLGACDGLSPLTFAPVPESQILAARSTVGCLSTLPPAVSLPFSEEFTTSPLDPNLWTYNNGGAFSTLGIDEPSAPTSFLLDSTGSGLYADDELRSNRILLGGTNDPNLRVFVQHRGVESGEELVIDYLNSGLDWVELDRIVSDGVDEVVYTPYVYSLPGPARHNGFRVRFRTEVDSATDDWFIDDVLVTEGPPPPLVPPTILSIVPAAGPTSGSTFTTITGTDFSADIQVFIGGQPLGSLIYVGPGEIRGHTPANPIPGPVVVIANQTSGSDILDPGYIYTQEDLRHGDALAAPGALTVVPVTADHETPLAGFSVAMEFPADEVSVVEVSEVGTATETADFFTPAFDNSTAPGGGWWNLGVVLSFSGQTVLPPSPDTLLAFVTYAIPPGTPIGTEIEVTPVSGVGVPPTDNIFVGSQGVALTPTLLPGRITIAGALFIRGDANRDSALDIADAIAILDYLFSADPATCLDAIDANDDGDVNIADAVRLLGYLFSGEDDLAEPFPSAGTDPTSDPLDCQS